MRGGGQSRFQGTLRVSARVRGIRCGALVGDWSWRTGRRRATQQHLRRTELFDQDHRSTTQWTRPEAPAGHALDGEYGLGTTALQGVDQLSAQGQQAGAAAVCQESEVSNPHKAARQHVQQEPSQELVDGQAHNALLVAMSGVAPAKGDVSVFER